MNTRRTFLARLLAIPAALGLARLAQASPSFCRVKTGQALTKSTARLVGKVTIIRNQCFTDVVIYPPPCTIFVNCVFDHCHVNSQPDVGFIGCLIKGSHNNETAFYTFDQPASADFVLLFDQVSDRWKAGGFGPALSQLHLRSWSPKTQRRLAAWNAMHWKRLNQLISR